MVQTKDGYDPCYATLLAHLVLHEFSPRRIEETEEGLIAMGMQVVPNRWREPVGNFAGRAKASFGGLMARGEKVRAEQAPPLQEFKQRAEEIRAAAVGEERSFKALKAQADELRTRVANEEGMLATGEKIRGGMAQKIGFGAA